MPEASAINTAQQAPVAPEAQARSRAVEKTEPERLNRDSDIIKKQTTQSQIEDKSQAEAAVFHKDDIVVEKEEPPADTQNSGGALAVATPDATGGSGPLEAVPQNNTTPSSQPATGGTIEVPEPLAEVSAEPPESAVTTIENREAAATARETEREFEKTAEESVAKIEDAPPQAPPQAVEPPDPNEKQRVEAQERADSAVQNKPIADQEVGGTVDVAI